MSPVERDVADDLRSLPPEPHLDPLGPRRKLQAEGPGQLKAPGGSGAADQGPETIHHPLQAGGDGGARICRRERINRAEYHLGAEPGAGVGEEPDERPHRARRIAHSSQTDRIEQRFDGGCALLEHEAQRHPEQLGWYHQLQEAREGRGIGEWEQLDGRPRGSAERLQHQPDGRTRLHLQNRRERSTRAGGAGLGPELGMEPIATKTDLADDGRTARQSQARLRAQNQGGRAAHEA